MSRTISPPSSKTARHTGGGNSIIPRWEAGSPMRWEPANQNLPAFVNIGRPSSPVQLTGGYLGAASRPTPFQSRDTPIPNLKPPPGETTAERRRQIAGACRYESRRSAAYAINSDIAARPRLRIRRTDEAPRCRKSSTFANEPQHVLDLYGIGQNFRPTISAGSCCWPDASSNGAFASSFYHAGGGNGGWDCPCRHQIS